MDFIKKEFGWVDGISIILRLKYQEIFDNPFQEINKKKKPSRNQKLSQRQMGPMVIFYKILRDDGYSQEKTLEICGRLGKEVAVKFLEFNVPPIDKDRWKYESRSKKEAALKKLTKRFFNMEGKSDLIADDEFVIDVQVCHFAAYAEALGVPELGGVFCAADQYFFEKVQHDILFSRTQTLAIEKRPCDFRFKLKE